MMYKGWRVKDNGKNYHPATGRFSAVRHGVGMGNTTLAGLTRMIDFKTAEEIAERLIVKGFDLSTATEDGAHVKCSQCQAMTINGTAIHEERCPNENYECRGCYARVSRRGSYCEDCQ